MVSAVSVKLLLKIMIYNFEWLLSWDKSNNIQDVPEKNNDILIISELKESTYSEWLKPQHISKVAPSNPPLLGHV